MANMKKVDKAGMLSRLDELEKAVVEMGVAIEKLSLEKKVGLLPTVNADGKTVLTDKTIFAAVELPVMSKEVHECQVNTCKSMATKPYERPTGRMWLCDVHKF